MQGYVFRYDSKAVNYHQEHTRGKTENRDQFKNFNYFCSKYSGLDVMMMKMDWYGKITLDEANAFCKMLKKYKGELKQAVLEELSKAD